MFLLFMYLRETDVGFFLILGIDDQKPEKTSNGKIDSIA